MDFAVLEVETLPDIAGARRIYGLAPDVSDKNVAKVIFHHLQRAGGRRPFLPPHLKTLSVVSLVACRDERLRLSTWSVEEGDEGGVIEAFGRQQASLHGDIVVWDGGRDLTALFAVRSMVTRCRMPPVGTLALDDMIGGFEGAEDGRVNIARRLGVASEETVSDESSWDQFHEAGFAPLVRRCALNAGATARLWLSYSEAAGRITTEDHDHLINQFDRLREDGSSTAAA